MSESGLFVVFKEITVSFDLVALVLIVLVIALIPANDLRARSATEGWTRAFRAMETSLCLVVSLFLGLFGLRRLIWDLVCFWVKGVFHQQHSRWCDPLRFRVGLTSRVAQSQGDTVLTQMSFAHSHSHG